MSAAEIWQAVDAFVEDTLHDADPALEAAVAAGREAGLPQIQVSAPQAKLLHFLAKLIGARRILEIGTLAGFSGIWLARALPDDGQLVTIELNPDYAEVAMSNFEAAGVADRVDLRVGAALDVLPQLDGPFDLTFIDADKPNNAKYLEWATRLSRRGGVIVLDNVVRGGAVLDSAVDANAAGAHGAVLFLAEQSNLDSTVIQTVGSKGYDGFAIAVVS